jgi:hypothetical protein
VLDPLDQPGGWLTRSDVASHLRSCPDCRDWFDAFREGTAAWETEPAGALTDRVMAATTGLDDLLRELPALAEMDPGPGFAECVLLATSRSSAPDGWHTRLASAWWALVRRPRFAWEVAYVAIVCWVLVFGNPVRAWEWGSSTVTAAARQRLSGPVTELGADLASWRQRWIPDQVQGQAAGPVDERVENPIVRAWQAGARQMERVRASVVRAMEAAWTGVSGWIRRFVDVIFPPRTEPDAEAARSAQ